MFARQSGEYVAAARTQAQSRLLCGNRLQSDLQTPENRGQRAAQRVRVSGIIQTMAARNRNSVAPAPSSESQMTYSRFLELFPDNDACLEHLKQRFYPDGSECPKCGKTTKFHRIKSRA